MWMLKRRPDCLRIKYLRADARRTLARSNARPSCARMPPVDACSLLRARDLRACALDYPRLPARQVSTRRCAAYPCAHECAPVMCAHVAGRCLQSAARPNLRACAPDYPRLPARQVSTRRCAACPCAHECAPVMRAHAAGRCP